jgi:hypothetical protein
LTLAVLVEQAHSLIESAKTIEHEAETASAIDQANQPSSALDNDPSHT